MRPTELRNAHFEFLVLFKTKNTLLKLNSRIKVCSTQFLTPAFHSPFSLEPLILWSPKMAAGKLRIQTSIFDSQADVCAVAIAK